MVAAPTSGVSCRHLERSEGPPQGYQLAAPRPRHATQGATSPENRERAEVRAARQTWLHHQRCDPPRRAEHRRAPPSQTNAAQGATSPENRERAGVRAAPRFVGPAPAKSLMLLRLVNFGQIVSRKRHKFISKALSEMHCSACAPQAMRHCSRLTLRHVYFTYVGA
jgi:hypothetical protein